MNGFYLFNIRNVLVWPIQDFTAEGPMDLWWGSAQRSRKPTFQRETTDDQGTSDLLNSFVRDL